MKNVRWVNRTTSPAIRTDKCRTCRDAECVKRKKKVLAENDERQTRK